MRILVLITDLFDSIGGIQTFNRAFVHALDGLANELGWDVTVQSLVDRGDSALAAQYLPSGRTRYLGYSGSKLRYAVAAIKNSWRADQTIIGHANMLSLALGMPGRTGLILHGVEAWKRLPYLKKKMLRRMIPLISVSRFTQREVTRLNNISDSHFAILPNTLDPFYQAKAQGPAPGFPAGKKILTVSRLHFDDRYKNIDMLIESLALIRQRVPDCCLIIVGDGPDRARLQAIATTAGVAKEVIFAGRIPDEHLGHYYDACDVFALPSLGEGFGIVYLEAMRHGKPVVAARATAVPEVVDHGVTGLLVEPDTKSLASGLVEVLSNNQRARAMGVAGQMRMRDHFEFSHYRMRLRAAFGLTAASEVGVGR